MLLRDLNSCFFACGERNRLIPCSAQVTSLTSTDFIPFDSGVQISLVVWMFQYPPRTAIAVGLGMAQIGEFAFVLLSSASQHGLLPYQVYMLLMGAPHGQTWKWQSPDFEVEI